MCCRTARVHRPLEDVDRGGRDDPGRPCPPASGALLLGRVGFSVVDPTGFSSWLYEIVYDQAAPVKALVWQRGRRRPADKWDGSVGRASNPFFNTNLRVTSLHATYRPPPRSLYSPTALAAFSRNREPSRM